MISWSILICSLACRAQNLNNLLHVLKPQLVDGITLHIEIDNGESSIGKKRQILLDKVNTFHCSFIDDDDMIVNDYVQSICEYLPFQYDYLGFRASHYQDGMYQRDYSLWAANKTHIGIWKSTIAKQGKFPDTNHAEDSEWIKQISPLVAYERYIDRPLYQYYQKSPWMKNEQGKDNATKGMVLTPPVINYGR